MKWNEIIPVAISVVVIILVAVLEKHSKLVAAVTATMPLTMPLALWIVYSSSQGDQASVRTFTSSLLVGILPTVAFAVALWISARLGFKLAPMLAVGYLTWGIVLTILILVRRAFIA
jgi:hypothetical protein